MTLAVVIGILVDRWCGLHVVGWGTIILAGLLLATLTSRHSLRISTLSLLTACVAVGGLRHHLNWWTVPADDISRLLLLEPRPVRVIGVIVSPIDIVGAEESAMTPAWMQVDRSICHLQCEEVSTHDNVQVVSGMARLLVSGHLLHADVGDRVEISGRLSAPRGPTNPGAFDYSQYVRRQGVRALIDCNHPDSVEILAPAATNHFQRWRSKLRQECQQVFAVHLDPRTESLASSLLLGERSQLPIKTRDAFVESGTMHLLAISGLHVGILAGLLLVVCRLLRLPVLATTLVVLTGVATFACITNLRPPVVRASVLAMVVAVGWPMYRTAGGTNLIAACGLVVLLINPTDLFDTGTQLSFLAVLAIGWAANFIATQRRSIDEESLLPRLLSRRPGVGQTVVRCLLEGYIVTAAIWLFTLPLTVAVFHVAAPVGFLVNVLLIPYVAVVLGLGFLTMTVGLLLPWFAGVPGALFGLSLRGLLGIVDAASSLHLGHASLAGPSSTWLLVFYSLLAIVLLLPRWPSVRRWGWSAVLCWIIVGQVTALLPTHRHTLRCTVLDVGHGCCVVLQLPGGENLLYDAGILGGERRGQQIVQSALWELGVRRIDGIVVSHADIDHFNAIASLVETMPVGTLLFNRSFLDFAQEPVAALCQAASRAGVPIKLLDGGDRLLLSDGQCAIDVLHPSQDWRADEDNENSLVARITFGGRTILLTGDVERVGLQKLMEDPISPLGIDVLLAPHHGSLRANPPSFARWGQPEIVIVSGGTSTTAERLRDIYGSAAHLLTTRDRGAISLEVSQNGELSVTPYVAPSARPGSTPI